MTVPADQEILRRPQLWLALAFLLPNLVLLSGGFIYDDVPLLVTAESMHSLAGITQSWTEPFWPDRPLLTLYRPVTKTIWTLLWVASDGSPVAFHLFSLVLGCGAVLLLFHYLLALGIDRTRALLTAWLFALFPIHSEAIAPVFGSAELLAAVFGLGALLAHRRDHRVVAILLFALAVFSKESAAALAAIAYFAAPPPRRRFLPEALAAGVIVAAILVARALVAPETAGIPAADNPMSLQGPFDRVLGALWIQCLYLWKTFVPVHLAVEYGYRQIPLVTSIADPRAVAGLGLLASSIVLAWRSAAYRTGVLVWWILFLPAANILFPIGTIMAERLAYLPSAGAALVAATWLSKRRSIGRGKNVIVLLALLFLIYGGRTLDRNLVWTDTDRFYDSMVADAPAAARAHFGRGTYLASRGRDAEAVEAYARAIEILPLYAEAHFNRANALVRLGRTQEAIEAYQRVARLAPGQTPAERNLLDLLSGRTVATAPTAVDGSP